MKKWLTERFLPMWAKKTVLADNRQLRQENDALKERLREQQAYIRGMQGALRAAKKIAGGTQ